MNYDLIFALVFYTLLYLFYLKHKNKFEIQNKVFALYKTKIGINLMDKYAKKFPKILNFFSYVSIFIGFTGMFFILYTIVKGTYLLIFVPKSSPVLAPVLPGVTIPGLPTLGFWHWIIAIFIVAVIHEFSHGVYARLYNLKVKSSGFAFLGPILAAFVEPDEKALVKKSRREQLAILSAGPFSNIVLAIVILLIFNFIFLPLQSNWFVNDGVSIVDIEKNSPAGLAQLKNGLIIKEINNEKINDQKELPGLIQKSNGENIKILTDKGEFNVKPDKKNEKYHVGISVTNLIKTKENIPEFVLPLTKWINMLLFWLWVVSLGIGLFNLLPLGPIDGGRMFHTAASGLFNEKTASNVFKYITIFCLALIFINLVPYLIKFFSWIISYFS